MSEPASAESERRPLRSPRRLAKAALALALVGIAALIAVGARRASRRHQAATPWIFGPTKGPLRDAHFVDGGQSVEVVCDHSHRVEVWSVATRSLRASLDLEDDADVMRLTPRADFVLTENALPVTGDEQPDERIELRALGTGAIVWSYRRSAVPFHSLAISPDGSLLAEVTIPPASSGPADVTSQVVVSLRSMRDGSVVQKLVPPEEKIYVGAVTFSPRGDALVLSSRYLPTADGDAGSLTTLWTLALGKRRFSKKACFYGFSSKGELILSTLEELFLGSGEDGSKVRKIGDFDASAALAVEPSGASVLVFGQDGFRLLELERDEIV